MDNAEFNRKIQSLLSRPAESSTGPANIVVGEEEQYVLNEVDSILKRLIIKVNFVLGTGCNKVHVMPLYEGDYIGQEPHPYGDGQNLSTVAGRVSKVLREANLTIEFQLAGGPNYHMFLLLKKPSACL